MNKRWNILKAEDSDVAALQSSLGINGTICKILIQRGIRTYDEAKSFFRPLLSQLHDPFLMKDMDKAIDRIQTAFDQKEKILVFGDYDVDGTTSVASMFQFLSAVYSDVDFYIPHRYKEGYGVSKAGIDYALERNITLIISLDCGIKSIELIAYAKSMGIDFIVCDHHLPEKELPEAVAILNPKQADCPYPFKELCGCGVGFKLMQALSKTMGLADEAYLQYLDLVATAIAADIVPIIGENRVLAHYGLKKVNDNPSVGIAALMKLAGAQRQMLITNLVFIIAPRVNAAGRMDDARKAVQLFIEKDPEKAFGFAEMLHSDNTDRKEADANITEEALSIINADIKLIERKTTVIYQEHWHKGVVGIVASRLIDKGYYRPTVILTRSGEIVAGSARSVAGFNLYEAVHACREHLLGYGGHFAAAGMTLALENVEAFSNKFEEVVSNMIDDSLLIPEIVIDAEAGLNELTLKFYDIISQMEPFGPDNMRPIFLARNVFDTGYSKLVKDKHVRFDVKQNNSRLTGIGFDMAEKLPIIQSGTGFDIVFTAELNEWNGDRTVQMKVIDVRESHTL